MWTGIHTAVSLPLAFFVNVLIARTLGAEGYGRLAYLTTLITIATVIAGLGVGTALIQFGAKEHAAGQRLTVQRYLSGAQGFRMLVMGPLVALTVVSIIRVDAWLLSLALIFGVGMPAFLGTGKDTLTIENRTDRSAQITMVGNIVTQVVVVAAVLVLGTADSVWAARVVVSGLMMGLPLAFIAKEYRLAVLKPRGPWMLPRKFWRFALPTGIASMVGALTSNRIEVVFLDWFADPVAMGLFGLAFGLAGHVYAPAQALIGPLVPAISGLSQVDRQSVRQAFLRTTRVSSTIGGLLVASVLPPLAVLVPTIYGRDFEAASDHVVALGLAAAITLVGSPHKAFLLARLGGARVLWISITVLVCNILLAILLIPAFGTWGATITCAAAMLVRVALITSGEARSLEVSPGHLIKSLAGVIVGVAIAASVWTLVRELDVSPWGLAALVGAGGAATYAVTTRFIKVGFSPDDVEALLSGLPLRLRGVARKGLKIAAHYTD